MAKLKRDKKTNNTLQKQSLSWSDIPELVIPIRMLLDKSVAAYKEATETRVPIG